MSTANDEGIRGLLADLHLEEDVLPDEKRSGKRRHGETDHPHPEHPPQSPGKFPAGGDLGGEACAFKRQASGQTVPLPARGYAWPLVFLDAVATPRARAVTHKYDALIVETSPAGGCHIWLACARRLAESSRLKAQRWLAQRLAADLGSISGEHLGRLAGFKN